MRHLATNFGNQCISFVESEIIRVSWIASSIIYFFVLQITLASNKKRGLIVAQRPAMFLQVKGDSPSSCFGTIRYISFSETGQSKPPSLDRQILVSDRNAFSAYPGQSNFLLFLQPNGLVVCEECLKQTGE